VTARAATRGGASRSTSTAAAATGGVAGDWPAIVAALGLQGPVTQLAAHCVLVGRKGEVVQLRLDPAGSTFRRPQLEQKLAEALSRHYGEAVRLSIATSDAEEPTPARAKAQAADERQRSAEQAIESDANVRALRDVFGATVQPGSVKPLN
jgi:DNA polymerase-3 subunit gamma/tau